MSYSDLRLGFLYENYEPNSSKYHAAAIDFWQTSNSKTFDCGDFQTLQDLLHLATIYAISLPDETIRRMSSSERANPCGLENAFFFLREKILKVSDSSNEYLVSSPMNSQALIDKFSQMQFNWIDDFTSYLNWLRFLNSGGEAIQEAGRVQQPLPTSFSVIFKNGFAGLGKQFPVYLAIYSESQINFVAVGIAMVLVGIVSLSLALTNIIGMRRVNKFKHA